jgi:hypothetical protein
MLWLPSNCIAGIDVSEERTTFSFNATLCFSEALQQITCHLHSGVFSAVKVSDNAQLQVQFISTMTQRKKYAFDSFHKPFEA